MGIPLYLTDGDDLIVTANEFSAIKELECKCERSDIGWDEHRWIGGLRSILGGRMPKLYTKVKLIVDWSL